MAEHRLMRYDELDPAERKRYDDALPSIRALVKQSVVGFIGEGIFRGSGVLFESHERLFVATAGHVIAEHLASRKNRKKTRIVFAGDSKECVVEGLALGGKSSRYARGEPDLGIIELRRGVLDQLPGTTPVRNSRLGDGRLDSVEDHLIVIAGYPYDAEAELGVSSPVLVTKTTHLKSCDPSKHRGEAHRWPKNYGWHVDWSEDLRADGYRPAFDPGGISGGAVWAVDPVSLNVDSARLIAIPWYFRSDLQCVRVAPITDWVRMLTNGAQ